MSLKDPKQMDKETKETRNGTNVTQQEEKSIEKYGCKKVFKFAFSQLGLCGLVILYSIMGAFLFRHLEEANERQMCKLARSKYKRSEAETVDRLWFISRQAYDNYQNETHYRQEFKSTLGQYQQNVLDLNYGGTECEKLGKKDGESYNWAFSGALLFSVTVITTIGYGNIAPKTFWGRFVCIAYAVLGIPLMLLCLANIGDVLADIFRFIYTKVCCCGCFRKKGRESENNEADEGRTSPETWKEEYSRHVVDDDDDDEEDDDDDDDYTAVPLTVTMLLITGYLFFGAIIFNIWDGMNAYDAAYFSFVTISTIGFGDLVPGTTFKQSGEEYKMIFLVIYMLFGMAVLSMCFSLIQEEMVAKFRWLGQKLGIIDKDAEISDTFPQKKSNRGFGKNGEHPNVKTQATHKSSSKKIQCERASKSGSDSNQHSN